MEQYETVDELRERLRTSRLEPEYLSREEIIAQIEVAARQRRGWSARHLLRAYRTGRLDQWGEVADILCLAGLLDDDDPIYLPPPRRQRPVR